MICILQDCQHKGEDQPLDNFPSNPYEKSGYSKICKDCDAKAEAQQLIRLGTLVEYEKEVKQKKEKKFRENNLITVNGEKCNLKRTNEEIKKKCLETLITIRKTKKIIRQGHIYG